MTVGIILAEKGRETFTIEPSASLADAVKVLADKRIGAALILGADRRIAGILSERDIVRALATQGVDALEAKVADLMTREVRVCDEETTMANLMGLMTEHHIRHVPVVKEKALVGLVSIGDVVKARLDELELDKKELLDYVSAR